MTGWPSLKMSLGNIAKLWKINNKLPRSFRKDLEINIINFVIFRYITRLPNKYATYEVPFELWNHLDYLWGIDAKTILYPEIIKNMDTFSNSPKQSETCT